MEPSALGLALRQLQRDWRAGQLRLLALAVVLAVAALTAVGFFADRLATGLKRDAAQLLGGDAVVASDQPTPQELQDKAKGLGLAMAFTANFPSMARAPDEKGGASTLVAVKAVSPRYPLRGQLTLHAKANTNAFVGANASPTLGAQAAPAGGPQPGTVWVDVPLLEQLGLAVGDSLWLGDLRLQVAHTIAIEPDRGAGFMSFAPRVMLAQEDLRATGLVQAASRITYRMAVSPIRPSAQGQRAVSEFVAHAEQRIEQAPLRGVRVESLESGRPEMRQTLERAEKFLNLVALLAALLAAVAVAIAARDFAQRHLDDCAMLRVLGLSQKKLATSYALEFATVGLAASVAGVLLGFAVHYGFVHLMAGLLQAQLPAPSAWPALAGLAMGLALLAAFGLPPVLQLARVPPLRVMRRDVGNIKGASLGVLLAGLAGFAALLLALAGDVRMGSLAVGGFAAAVGLFALTAWVAVKALARAVPQARAPRWLVLATRQVASRPGLAMLQVAALAVGLLALTLLALLRTDLIDSWRKATPADAPNRFVINLQPDQEAAYKAFLAAQGVSLQDWYPMIRGRLVGINGEPATPARFAGKDRAQRLVDREFNLSHSAALPGHNQVIQGRWTAEEAQGLSVEEGLAQTLGLKMGDRLQFDVAGQLREGRITNLRKVDWGSFRVNFFVLFPLSQMQGVPITFISAFKAPPQTGFDRALTRQFPNATVVDVSATVAQVQRVLGQVIAAVQVLFLFTLAAGLLVLFAAVSATREARARELALMRAMGAGSGLLTQVQRAELLGLGALAGFVAALAALGVGWVLARYAFEFTWAPSPWVPLVVATLGAVLAWAAGWWSLRNVLKRPVLQSLREAGAV